MSRLVSGFDRRWVAAVVAANLLLVLLYIWSLDEVHTVSVNVTGRTAVVNVDGNPVTLSVSGSGRGFGIETSPYSSYFIQATGEAAQPDVTSPVGHLAEQFRLVESPTGWQDIAVDGESVPARSYTDPIERGGSTWSQGDGGAWEAGPGSWEVLGNAHGNTGYSISANLLRPDGSPALLFAVDTQGQGYAVVPQYDRSYFVVTRWSAGTGGQVLYSGIMTYMPFWSLVKRVLRYLLTGYLYALALCALSAGLYPILSGVLPGESSDETAGTRWMERMPAWVLPAAVAIIGLVCTSLVATYLLQRIPHVQDSVAYLFEAKILASGSFSVPAPPAAIQSFFREQYVPMYSGRWFAQYPPGAPLVLMFGVFVGAPWLIGPICSSLSLAGVLLIGRKLYGFPVGVLAAVLGLLSPFWLFLGSSFMSHPEGLLFATVFLLALALGEEGGDARWLSVAGASAGMLFITRELTAAAFLLPFAVWLAPRFVRNPRRYVGAIVAFALVAAILLAYNWTLMGNPFQSTYAAEDPLDHPGFGHVPWGYFTPAHGLWNVAQNLEMLSAHLFGWPYSVCLAVAAVPFIAGAARRWDVLLLLSFLCVALVYMFYHVSGLMYGSRYYFEALPCLLLLTARGFVELVRLPLRLWPRFGVPRDLPLAMVAPGCLFMALTVFYLRFYLPAQIPIYRGYNFSSDAELQAVAGAHIHHAIVFVVDTSPVVWPSYGNVFFANAVQLNGDIVYAHDQGAQDSALYPYFPGRSHYRLTGTTLTKLP